MVEEEAPVRCERDAGSGVQLRRARPNGVTKKRLEQFLAALAATCNVTSSAAAAGLSSTAVYARRRSAPGFAKAWEEAICEGYARLELMLLESALASYAPAEEGEGAARPKVSDQSALRLLQQHRQQVTMLRAAQEAGAEAAEEAQWTSARAELEARLLQMHERLTGSDGGGGE